MSNIKNLSSGKLHNFCFLRFALPSTAEASARRKETSKFLSLRVALHNAVHLHCEQTNPNMYGAPFVACTLLLTKANFVQQKSLLSNKSHFCLTKVILSMTKEILSTTKLLLSDKS